MSTPRSQKPRATSSAGTVPSPGLAAAVSRGKAAKRGWVESGEVVPARAIASAWGVTTKLFAQATERGDAFLVVIDRRRYCPKEFLALRREDVGAVCIALEGLSPSEKLVFWKRPHGALDGKTVLESLAGPQRPARLASVVALAHAWAAEAHAESTFA